jgi:hypothetical protein
MKCAECHKPISPREQKQAVFDHDANGRITAAYHRHHARRAKAKARTDGAVPGLVYHEWRPGAYDVDRETSDVDEPDPDQEEALRRHQERMAADREQEDVPERWDDWRGEETATLEELVDRVEAAVDTKGDGGQEEV